MRLCCSTAGDWLLPSRSHAAGAPQRSWGSGDGARSPGSKRAENKDCGNCCELRTQVKAACTFRLQILFSLWKLRLSPWQVLQCDLLRVSESYSGPRFVRAEHGPRRPHNGHSHGRSASRASPRCVPARWAPASRERGECCAWSPRPGPGRQHLSLGGARPPGSGMEARLQCGAGGPACVPALPETLLRGPWEVPESRPPGRTEVTPRTHGRPQTTFVVLPQEPKSVTRRGPAPRLQLGPFPPPEAELDPIPPPASQRARGLRNGQRGAVPPG